MLRRLLGLSLPTIQNSAAVFSTTRLMRQVGTSSASHARSATSKAVVAPAAVAPTFAKPPRVAGTNFRLPVSAVDPVSGSSFTMITSGEYSDGSERNEERQQKENNGWKYGFGFAAVAGVLMFSPLPIYKKHTNRKELAKNLPHRVGKAVVFTWHPNAETNSIGHQTMLVESLSGERFYVSLWPSEDHSLKVNILPLKFARLNAQFLDDIQDDIKKEDGNRPDSIAVIYNLDFDQMLAEYQKMRQAVDKGELSFTLFQNTPSVLPLLSRSSDASLDAELLSRAPFSEMVDEDTISSSKLRESIFHNCTSMVHHLLVKGKYPTKLSFSPWGASPIGQHGEFVRIGAKLENDPVKFEKYIESARNAQQPQAESPDRESHNRSSVGLKRG